MNSLKFRSCCVVLLFALDMQSLVDVAREEAERRRQLEQQGVQGKVIEGNGLHLTPTGGNITTSTSPPGGQVKSKDSPISTGEPAALRRYQSELKKLDREIQKSEVRLASVRTRLQNEKWESLKSGRSRTKDSRAQREAEIEKLQEKLKQLREERFEVYEAGKKAGFLPGELDGKGLVP